MIKKFLSLMSLSLLACACSHDDIEPMAPAPEDPQSNTYTLIFNGERPTFEGASRAESLWKEGDKVYVGVTESTYLECSYSGEEWTAEAKGEGVAPGKYTDCVAYYIETSDITVDSNSSIQLDPGKYAVYCGYDCEVNVHSDKTIELNAYLEANCSRVKFVSDLPTETIAVKGAAFHTSIDLTTCVDYVSANKCAQLNFSYNSETQKYESEYLYFNDASNIGIQNKMRIKKTESYYNYVFRFDNPTERDFYSSGKSGTMNLPNTAAHQGWTMENYDSRTNSSFSIYSNSSYNSSGKWYNPFTHINTKMGISVDFRYNLDYIYYNSDPTTKLYIYVDGENTEKYITLYDKNNTIDTGDWYTGSYYLDAEELGENPQYTMGIYLWCYYTSNKFTDFTISNF